MPAPRIRLMLLVTGMALTAVGSYWGLDALLLDPMRQGSARLSTLQQELVEVRQRRSSIDRELAQLLSSAAGAQTPSEVTLQHADPPASLAFLQEEVRASISAVGGVLVSSQSGSQQLSGDITRLQVLLRARIDEAGLFEFLRTVEAQEPIIVVDSLEIRPTSRADGQPPLDFTGVLVAFHSNAN